MAAAILMMNMHGAVCASSRNHTIFRYSEKIPFAIMVDPTSELRWDDIIMAYQDKKSLTQENTFDESVKDFYYYLKEALSHVDKDIMAKENKKLIVCVGYEPKEMFPRAEVINIAANEKGFNIFKNTYEISSKETVFQIHLGNCENIRILSGGVSEDIVNKMGALLHKTLANLMGNTDAATCLIEGDRNSIAKMFTEIQEDPKVTQAVSEFTIKDMVSMAENLIETEGLLGSNDSIISPTREIGIVTLAEGFVYIKHSLYGA